MCLGCCTRLNDACGRNPKSDLPIDLEILSLIDNNINTEKIQDRRDNLEHECVHYGKIETLRYLLKDEKRSLYRRGKRSDLFYYNLFRGLCTILIKGRYPEDVVSLFMNTIKHELSYPQFIFQWTGVIRSAESFELDMQTIISKMFWYSEHKMEIEFLRSFWQREDCLQMREIQKGLYSDIERIRKRKYILLTVKRKLRFPTIVPIYNSFLIFDLLKTCA